VLNPEFARNAALLERFRMEARAQASLNHSNIAMLHAFLTQGSQAWMVMEYVDGETIAHMLARRGLLPPQVALPLFKQALLGIGYAHRMAIVHRDIKPANLMVNSYGIVKVMDFGIAKVMGGRSITRTGAYVGSVAYMSPEQVMNLPVDIRSDTYALGVTLFEMLTAHLPFEGQSDFQIMNSHVHHPPPRPAAYYPHIPPALENVVLKALAKHPDSRFQTVEEFGAALDATCAYVQPPLTVARAACEPITSSTANPPVL
jgi:serine/threonine-protein kinase